MTGAGQAPALRGQVGLVTGGGRGVGRAVAEELAAAGMAVAVLARTPAELDLTVRGIEAAGGTALALVADVTDEVQVRAAVARASAELGPLDLVVANAGRFAAGGRLWEVPAELWWGDVEVNLRGPLFTLQATLPALVARGSGRVVTVASGIGTVPSPAASSYACSKAALLRLTDSLAEELRGSGVSAFAISPGLVRTAMTSFPEGFLAWQPQWRNLSPERFGPAAGAGRLVAALASGAYDELSGRFLHVTTDLAAAVEVARSERPAGGDHVPAPPGDRRRAAERELLGQLRLRPLPTRPGPPPAPPLSPSE